MASSIERASEQLADVIASLGAVTGDLDVAAQLLAVLGWDLPPGVTDIGLAQLDFAAVAARLDELIEVRSRGNASDLELAAAAAEVIAALAETFAHVENIARALQATPDYLAATRIADELFPRLADLIVIEAVRNALPDAVPIGTLLGVFEFPVLPADPAIFQVEHIRSVVRWDRFSTLINDPTDLLREVYGWGTPDFNGAALVTNVGRVLEGLAMEAALDRLPRSIEERIVGQPVPEAETAPGTRIRISIDHDVGFDAYDVGLTIYSLRASAPGGTDGGIGISPYAFGTTDRTFPLSESRSLVLTASAALESGIGLLLRAGRDPELRAGIMEAIADADPSFGLALRIGAPTGERVVLFSAPNISFDAAAVSAGVRVAAGASLNPSVHAAVEDGRIRVAPDGADGFLASVLPADGVTATLALEVSWSHQDGLRFKGGAGLRTSLPLHARLGPLQIDTLDLAVTGTPAAFTGAAAVTGAVALGPFTATLEGVGAAAVLRFQRGNMGPADLSADFLPPLGVGLSIDAAAVSGGGFIRYDPAVRRYSGVLHLHAGEVDITALGILDAQLPGGAPGFALLVALRATFPAIQIGFGFALTSVGGLLALNRRVDVDALRAQLATGTAGRILAPEDPVRNAPALLADLGTVFPLAPGVTVIGPTAQLLWANLVRFDIGVFIELPGPSRIVLLGSARAVIEGAGRTYLVIRVDVVGVVDLQQRIAAFDAVLIGSQLLEILELTGGAAFRLSWGDRPYAVFTLGGFHPAFNPEPMVLPPTLTRIAMVHGTPEDRLYLRFEGYFAVTSNTLQFGAAVQAIIRSGNFNIQGILAFDALIRFQPFHFRVDIRASVRVRYKSRNLAGLTLTGALEGPGPVVLRAKVCIELLFFDICFSQTFTLGASAPPPVTAIGSALAVFVAEAGNPATLHASGPADRFVMLRPPPQGSRPIVSPAGQLVWVQRQAPLGLLLQRVGGAPLGVPQTVEATSADAASAELDWFAPGSFADLTDDQALTRRGFERLNGGLRFGAAGMMDGPSQQRMLTVRQIRLPAKQQTTKTATAFPQWVVAAAARAHGAPPPPEPVTGTIAVTEERWTVLDAATGETHAAGSGAQAHQLAAAGAAPGRRVAIPAGDRLPSLVF